MEEKQPTTGIVSNCMALKKKLTTANLGCMPLKRYLLYGIWMVASARRRGDPLVMQLSHS